MVIPNILKFVMLLLLTNFPTSKNGNRTYSSENLLDDLCLLYSYVLILLSATASPKLQPSPFNFSWVSQQFFRPSLFSNSRELFSFCLNCCDILKDQRLSQTDWIQFIKTGSYLRYLSLNRHESHVSWIL